MEDYLHGTLNVDTGIGARKLACSKEPNGCSRCIREHIRCHYSEQKPMGRPRKRRRNVDENEFSVEVKPYLPDPDSVTYFDDNLPVDPLFEHVARPIMYGEASMEPGNALKDIQPYVTGSDGDIFWHSGFESLKEPTSFSNGSTSISSVDPALHDTSPREFDFTEHQHHHAPNKPPCGCLAAMYLAMSSIQELPTDITSALATVRVAANTTRNVLRCEQCGMPKLVEVPPRIEVFQNTMMLGTIIPTVVNGYKRLLQMVDCETKLADAVGAKKYFRLKDYGCIEELSGEFEHLENIPLGPHEWRRAVRRLLQVDVNGHGNGMTGLKGIIAEMEARQRKRHKEVAKIATTDQLAIVGGKPCMGEKDALCLRMLDTAKAALNALEID